MSNSISFKTKYKSTDFIREYEITDVSNEAAGIETIRTKVNAINASLAGGQATTLANLFVADDYDSAQNIGTLENIYDIKLKTVTETSIPQTTYKLEESPEKFYEDFYDDLRADETQQPEKEVKE